MDARAPLVSPYKGLLPYTEADREYFFGRERDLKVIAANLIANPLTILYGASGVGKSSVLLAGVIPYLKEKSHLTVLVFRTWQSAAFADVLKEEVLDAVCGSLGADERQRARADLSGAAGLPFDDFLLECVKTSRRRLLLVLDQFEEYFLSPAAAGAVAQFDAEFARAVNRREIDAHFLLSMRHDGLDKLDRLQGRIPGLLNNTLRVKHLDRTAAERAIREPLKVYNRKHGLSGDLAFTIQDELVSALLEKSKPDVDSYDRGAAAAESAGAPQEAPGIETPVLQILLTRLWKEETADASRVLRLQTFEQKLGGADKIISTYLKEVMDSLNNEERELAVKVFKFLVTPAGTKIAQQPKSLAIWAHVPGEDAERRIESLLTRLSTSHPSSQQDIRIVRKITTPGQPDSYEIFHDVLGHAITEWRTRYEAERARRRLLLWIALLTVIACAIGGLAVFAFVQSARARQSAQEAQEQRREAERQKALADQALTRVNELDRAVPFFHAILRGHTDAVTAADFSPDAQLVVTASHDATARIWDGKTGETKFVLSNENRGPLNSAAFSHNGALVVTAGTDGVARVWDVATGQLKFELSGHQDGINRAVFSPDDQTILTASSDSTARTWAAADGSPKSVLRQHQGRVNYADFSHDGKWIITASTDNTAIIWDAETGAALRTLPSSDGEVNIAVFSPDDATVATGYGSGVVRLWDARTGAGRPPLRGHTGRVADVAFSPVNANILVTVGGDKKALLWNRKTGRPTELSGHTDALNRVAFSPDGEWVVTTSQDKTARVWQVVGNKEGDAGVGKLLAVLRGHAGPVSAVGFSGSGKLVVTASEDDTARVWDVSDINSFRIDQDRSFLRADPDNYDGACPVTIKISGRITAAGGSGKVRYQLFRKDGSPVEEEKELTFDSPGSKDVTATLKVNDSTSSDSVELRILEPKGVPPLTAAFQVQCSGGGNVGLTFRGCPAQGTAKSQRQIDLNVLKNRAVPASNLQTVTVAQLRDPANQNRWSNSQAVAVVGYVANVLPGGFKETNNCGRDDLRDIMINIVADASEADDESKYVVVEITPRWEEKFGLNDSDYQRMLQALSDHIMHKWVRFDGWMLYDYIHENASKSTRPNQPTCPEDGREHSECNWRATPWEIHPVTSWLVVSHP
jgi:WD40 repeat protein